MLKFKSLLMAAALLMCAGSPAQAVPAMEWELIVPAGVVEKAELKPAPRLTTLEGKTIVLRWNGKHNGDVLLEYL